MNSLIKIVKSYLLYIVSAFGISLGVIASIGVSSYNSMNLAIATTSGIKIGTVTILLNLIFLITYMIITKFTKWSKYAIQALAVIMFGVLINFFTYEILDGINDLTYIQRVVFMTVGTLIAGASIGGIIYYNMITFPLENLCINLSKKSSISFMKIRYLVDLIFIVISISISITNKLPLYVREGTIINFVLLSYSMNISRNFFEKYGRKKP